MLKIFFAVDQSRTYLNRIAGYSSYEQSNYSEALRYMNQLFAKLPADRILKKRLCVFGSYPCKKNSGYSKTLAELDKDNAELAKIKEKNESLKGPAKEKDKVSEEPLTAK